MFHSSTELNQVVRTRFSACVFMTLANLFNLRGQFLLTHFNLPDLVLQMIYLVVFIFH